MSERAWFAGTYYGISHPPMGWLLPLWRRLACPRGWHLWDEVSRFGRRAGDRPRPGDWSLVCDACHLSVHIYEIETTYCDVPRPRWVAGGEGEEG
jgi:hypothetical protein